MSDFEVYKGIDIVCGGFPCQAFSNAARGRNTAKDWWPEMRNVIDLVRPRIVIAENVAKKAVIKAGEDLRRIGYGYEIRNISASEAGAPHRRNRWWLCAYADKDSKFHGTLDDAAQILPELCQGLWGAENYSRVLRVSNGFPDRMDRYQSRRVKMLGNAVLPQIPQAIGISLMRRK